MRAILLISLWLGFLSSPVKAEDEIMIIVHVDNPTVKIRPDEISDFFLKRKRHWTDGSSVRFIDQIDGATSRDLFLKQIIKKTGREVDLFWVGQKLYTGDSAPIQVSSDAMTASLVAQFRGGIGYVSATFPITKGIKKVEVDY